MKPKGLTETTIAMCLMNIAGFAMIRPSEALSMTFQYVMVSVVIAVTFIILWYYWKGANWARILALFTAVVAIFNLVLISSSSPLVGAIIIIEAIFGAFMLWWLNTKKIKAYFKNNNAR